MHATEDGALSQLRVRAAHFVMSYHVPLSNERTGDRRWACPAAAGQVTCSRYGFEGQLEIVQRCQERHQALRHQQYSGCSPAGDRTWS